MLSRQRRKTRNKKRGGYTTKPSIPSPQEFFVSSADSVMNKYGCGKFSPDKAKQCINKLNEKLKNPQLSSQEAENIEIDIGVIENGIRYFGGKRNQKKTRRNK